MRVWTPVTLRCAWRLRLGDNMCHLKLTLRELPRIVQLGSVVLGLALIACGEDDSAADGSDAGKEGTAVTGVEGSTRSGGGGAAESGGSDSAAESAGRGVAASGGRGAAESGGSGPVDESGGNGAAESGGSGGVDESGGSGAAAESGGSGGSAESGGSGGSAESGGSAAESGAGGSSGMSGRSGAGGELQDAGPGAEVFDQQRPPEDADRMEAWLAEEYYQDWVCEPEPSKKTAGAAAIHAHGGTNRVCSNLLLAASKVNDGSALPEGVASVKELYNDAGELTGHAVAVKVDGDSGAGEGWYYWEGKGFAGRGIPACANCHSAAGSDDDHPGLGDFVYFQVRDEEKL